MTIANKEGAHHLGSNICIIGRGLMGGSIEMALDQPEVSQEEADVLILAVPLDAILEVAKELKGSKKKCIVMDIGSVKGEIAKQFEEWTDGTVEFVATHPMAGKEKSGYEHRDAKLFENAPWIITPHAKNTEEALLAVEELIRKLGARPFRMDAHIHDERVALVSHMPYYVSKALLELSNRDEREMAGPGFASMTRLACDNPMMRQEILRLNRKQIKTQLKRLIEHLEKTHETL